MVASTSLEWAIARFDPAIRMVLSSVGRQETVSADKAERELGWTMRPLQETLLDTTTSLIDYELVSA